MLSQEVISRLQTVALSCGHKSQRAFALAAGLNPIAFGENIRKAKEPRFSTLEAILKANPQVSAEWLMRGEGSMFRNGEQPPAPAIHTEMTSRAVGESGKAGGAFNSATALVEQLRRENDLLVNQLKEKNEQLRTKDEQLSCKDEQIRSKDEQMATLLSLLSR